MTELWIKFSKLKDKLSWWLMNEGVWATFRLCAARILSKLPIPFIQSQVVCRLEPVYDKKFGISTTGYLTAEELGINSSTDAEFGDYEPSNANEFLDVFSGLEIRFEDFAFVDLGSGKGRTLLLASQLGFAKIIGVEYSSSLHQIAGENLDKHSARSGIKIGIELVNEDAAEYVFPEIPTLVYMYNPFGEKQCKKLLVTLKIPCARIPAKSS